MQAASENLPYITAKELGDAMHRLCRRIKECATIKIQGAQKNITTNLKRHVATFQVLLATGSGLSLSDGTNVVAEPFGSAGSSETVTAAFKSIAQKLSAKILEVAGDAPRVDSCIEKVVPSSS